jgi:3-dehydroquinate synthase
MKGMGKPIAGGKKRTIQYLTLNGKPQPRVPVYTGKNIIAEKIAGISLKRFTRRAILTDENVAGLWYGKLTPLLYHKNDLLITIPHGEDQKNIQTLQNIWTVLFRNRFDRKSVIINAGGGVVCDIGAFAAATYMRGISFLQAPSTLLAQADAAIGGKAGINFGGIKNSIGLFAQPLAVVCDTQFLSTLPEREWRSGFAEIIKHSLIAGGDLFRRLNAADISDFREKEIETILRLSSAIKCNIVSSDPNEKGLRKTLNFGHTVGHALEMASHESASPLLHGEAVATGMVAEAKLSQLAGLLKNDELLKIEKIIAAAGLPLKAPRKFLKEVLIKIEQDKKNEGDRIKWVLLNGIGKAVYDMEQPEQHVTSAIEYVLE